MAASDQNVTAEPEPSPDASVGQDAGPHNAVEATSIQTAVQVGTLHGGLHVQTVAAGPASVRGGLAVGMPIAQAQDPFDLEVHRSITAETPGDLSLLPHYVRRAPHDEKLAHMVCRALAGASGMMMLVAGSSAGKTRACWEAIEPLRDADGWRLWHPRNPTRSEALLAGLDRVQPCTVVWLNEAQKYFAGTGTEERAEQVAASLRCLLAYPARAPVLVLGTLWPDHHDALTRDPGSQVRHLLDGTVIHVPHAFTGTDFDALADAAKHDPRLAWAAEHAEDGAITQHLAGGPEMVQRFHTAAPAARAVMLAAMDARRLGHRNALPLSLLEHAAPASLTDAEWHQMEDNWLEQALAYSSRSCKGALGPLTRIHPGRPHARPGRRSRDHHEPPHHREGPAQEPTYQLADYLEHWARRDRAATIPPIGFWAAAADHAHPRDLRALGDAARARGLYRDAAQLYKNAAAQHSSAAARLVGQLYNLHPGDHRPAHWAADHAPLGNPGDVGTLLIQLRLVGAEVPKAMLLARSPAAHVSLCDPYAVATLLQHLHAAGADHQVALLAHRAAHQFPLGKPDEVATLLTQMQALGAHEQAAVLADRVARETPLHDCHDVVRLLAVLAETSSNEQVKVVLARNPTAHICLDDPSRVGALLEHLRRVEADEQVAALVARKPAAHVLLDEPDCLYSLLGQLRELGAHDQVEALADRAVAETPLHGLYEVAVLLRQLHEAGADKQVAMLVARDPAAHVVLDDPGDLAMLLEQLHDVGADDQVAAVLARDPARHVSVEVPDYVPPLLRQLRALDAHEQTEALSQRAASETPLIEPYNVTELLMLLCEADADEHVATLLARDPASQVSLSSPLNVSELLEQLTTIGAHEQAEALGARAASEIPLDRLDWVAAVVKQLRALGAREQVTVLAQRAATESALGESSTVRPLLEQLRNAEADEQIAALIRRLPAAGEFDVFLTTGNHKNRFRFGREPDTTPAAAWTWDDLK